VQIPDGEPGGMGDVTGQDKSCEGTAHGLHLRRCFLPASR
jgi:hypothetical protein